MDALNALAPIQGANPELDWGGLSLGQACSRCSGSPAGLDSMAGMWLQYQAWNQLAMSLMTLLLSLMGGQSAVPGGYNGNASYGGGNTSYGGAAGSYGSSGPSPGFNTPGVMADPSQFQGGTETGRRLAAAALTESTDGDSQGGWCARDVKVALRQVGIDLPLGDAWAMAEHLAKHPKVREISCSRSDLDKLPPGAIVVWDRGNGSPYGHISISLGDGREASDLLRKQMQLRTSFRVFIPI